MKLTFEQIEALFDAASEETYADVTSNNQNDVGTIKVEIFNADDTKTESFLIDEDGKEID